MASRKRSCGTMPVHRRLLTESARYRKARDALENQTLTFRRSGRIETTSALIPVVVHVVHHDDTDLVGMGQIESQIDALNRDFHKLNGDLDTVPEVWRPIIGRTELQFALADRNPLGVVTDGVTVTRTALGSFADDDAVKADATGGSQPWPSERYLNIWVCNLGDLLGYAQFPGGPPNTDGVVIDYRAFGTSGTAQAPFNLGRTATHEVGHWLNLFHIWGDDGTGCGGTDYVDDTPNQGGPNTGLPKFPKLSCPGEAYGDMFMNFMDYTDDAGMVMFTDGQTQRMAAAIRASRTAFLGGAVGPPSVGGSWGVTDVTTYARTPLAAGDPVIVSTDRGLVVAFRDVDGHIQLLQQS